jgi:YD repeat-containing protein
VTVSYAYDNLSRLTAVSGTGLSPISYSYDALGRRTRMVDATGATTYQYDGLGRATQIVSPNGTLTFAYDRDGNRTTLGYPGAQNVTDAYSPGGRLSSVTDWANRASTFTYQSSGLASTLSYPNTVRATYSYDRAQRLTQLTDALGSTTITQHTYTLDPEGNRTALDEVIQGITPPPVNTWSPSVRVNDDASCPVQTAPAIGADGASYLAWEDPRAGFNGRRSSMAPRG